MNKSPTLAEFRKYYKVCGRKIIEEAFDDPVNGGGWMLIEDGEMIACAPYLAVAYEELYEDENE
jgi:hypothetical protein